MKIEDHEDFVDLVAQAVIDKIEERDRVRGLVEMVVARVFEMQQREAEIKAALAASTADSEAKVADTVASE